ncbi:hypothetical protein BS47DRAFT_1486216 [Hydnum rufescens UP504]|uniref:F-box domain-containing protein n=1 Tax=Hydnum rufescens UP504 TaxID=1448309 RepID=A0A9P6AV90_9AGAM|nr:hypothetical protein BS47DRAFT_1486216 [Hydnum rufescens UP504]
MADIRSRDYAEISSVQFLTLPVDVILDIILHLDVQDILVLQGTCRFLQEITEMRTVWLSAIHRRILSNGLSLPLPHDVPLSQLPAAGLKAVAIYVVRLDLNWKSPRARPCKLLELSPETPAVYVQFAFLVPGTAGRCLLTVTGGSMISFWELDSRLRRSKRVGGWTVEGSIVDVVCNSDPTDPATIGVRTVSQGRKVVVLYNVSMRGSNGTTKLEFKEIFRMGTLGRLKLLRGNLIVFYARINSFGCLYNYRTGVSVGMETHGLAKLVRATCLAIEVLSDYIIIIQPTSVDLFELPEVVTQNDVENPPDGGPHPIISARLVKTKCRPPQSEWTAGAIIPYTAPYPAKRSTPASRPISILIRERSENKCVIHYHIVYPPKGLAPVGSDAPWRHPGLDTGFRPAQMRYGVRQHFFQEIVVAPASGRGLWLENVTAPGMTHTAERLMIFSTVPPTKGDEWPMVDIGDANREGSIRWSAKNFPEAVRYCSFCSFDDSVGRVVVATQDGRVRVLEMAPS